MRTRSGAPAGSRGSKPVTYVDQAKSRRRIPITCTPRPLRRSEHRCSRFAVELRLTNLPAPHPRGTAHLAELAHPLAPPLAIALLPTADVFAGRACRRRARRGPRAPRAGPCSRQSNSTSTICRAASEGRDALLDRRPERVEAVRPGAPLARLGERQRTRQPARLEREQLEVVLPDREPLARVIAPNLLELLQPRRSFRGLSPRRSTEHPANGSHRTEVGPAQASTVGHFRRLHPAARRRGAAPPARCWPGPCEAGRGGPR